MSGGLKPGLSGGDGIPTASGAGQIPVSNGAGTAYTATNAATAVGLGAVTATGATAALARAAIGFPALSTALYVLRMNAAGTAMEFAAAAGGDSMLVDRSWNRPSPTAVAAGTRFLAQDDLSVQVSTGVAAVAGVDASGWVQDLAFGLYSDRAGLSVGVVYANSINLSAYVLGSMTFAALFKCSGTMSGGGLYCIGAIGDSNNGTRGVALFAKENAGNIDIVAIGGSGSVSTTVKAAAFAASSTALHAVAIAAVNSGGHKWRISVDGSAVVDVAMGANYVTPSTTDSVGFGSRSNGTLSFSGQIIDLMAWNSTVGSADMALLTTLPGTPTYALPESASTGAATIRVQASRWDSALPTVLRARGLPGGVAMTCSSVAKVTF